ncbi:hypothetical protein ABIB25_005763, partial [Nakamurella sp. UYEF19]
PADHPLDPASTHRPKPANQVGGPTQLFRSLLGRDLARAASEKAHGDVDGAAGPVAVETSTQCQHRGLPTDFLGIADHRRDPEARRQFALVETDEGVTTAMVTRSSRTPSLIPRFRAITAVQLTPHPKSISES